MFKYLLNVFVAFIFSCFRLIAMENGSFVRGSKVTQSLRVTAKELSLGGRGKSSGIAKIFSKWVTF